MKTKKIGEGLVEITLSNESEPNAAPTCFIVPASSLEVFSGLRTKTITSATINSKSTVFDAFIGSIPEGPTTAAKAETSYDDGHDHEYYVDSDGNGTAFKVCSSNSDQVCHSHQIMNGVVLWAQSKCYPNCKKMYGTEGVASHTHQLLAKPTTPSVPSSMPTTPETSY